MNVTVDVDVVYVEGDLTEELEDNGYRGDERGAAVNYGEGTGIYFDRY